MPNIATIAASAHDMYKMYSQGRNCRLLIPHSNPSFGIITMANKKKPIFTLHIRPESMLGKLPATKFCVCDEDDLPLRVDTSAMCIQMAKLPIHISPFSILLKSHDETWITVSQYYRNTAFNPVDCSWLLSPYPEKQMGVDKLMRLWLALHDLTSPLNINLEKVSGHQQQNASSTSAKTIADIDDNLFIMEQWMGEVLSESQNILIWKWRDINKLSANRLPRVIATAFFTPIQGAPLPIFYIENDMDKIYQEMLFQLVLSLLRVKRDTFTYPTTERFRLLTTGISLPRAEREKLRGCERRHGRAVSRRRYILRPLVTSSLLSFLGSWWGEGEKATPYSSSPSPSSQIIEEASFALVVKED